MSNLDWKSVKGLLFDLDGVLFVGDRVIDGAPETLACLKSKGIPCRFMTNTTTMSRENLHKKMVGLGLPIEIHEIFTAPIAAFHHLKKMGNPACKLLLAGDTLSDFQGIKQTTEKPEIIVIGDIGDRWNYTLMNELFNDIVNGAEMIALHKGKYWQVGSGLKMDIGAFVTGLEYVTGKQATVIGKPSAAFFRLVLEDLNLSAQETLMIGDDIDNDIGGAQNAGINGVLVRTGKFREDLVSRSSITPGQTIDSVADLMTLI